MLGLGLRARAERLVNSVSELGFCITQEAKFRRGARHQASGKHLLLVARYLPPAVNGGVYRPLSFMQYASESGWRMSALSGSAFSDEVGASLEQLIPSSVPVYRVDLHESPPTFQSWGQDLGSGYANALRMAQTACATLAEDPPSVVLASGPPFLSFVSAYWIARYFGAKLVLDYRDEWTQGTQDFVSLGRDDFAWEQKCLEAADAVCFVRHELQEFTLKAFSGVSWDKCRVIENGWEPTELEEARKLTNGPLDPSERLRLTFTGNMGGWNRPNEFLADLESLIQNDRSWKDHLELVFAGTRKPKEQRLIDDFAEKYPGCVRQLTLLPKAQSLRLLSDSNALLHFNPSPGMQRMMPGKTFEYLATGVPVLLYGDKGLLAETFVQLDQPYVVRPGKVRKLELFLRSLMNSGVRTGVNTKTADWLSQRTRRAQAKRLFAVCDELVDCMGGERSVVGGGVT